MSDPLTFTSSADGLVLSMLEGGFFEGWPQPPSPAEHLALMQGSSHVALALDAGVVIGYGTAISDGVLSAYIPLLEVLPHRRRQGVGRRLIEMLLDETGELYMVDVMCDDDVLPFYEALGFQPAGGAIRRNYTWRRPARSPEDE